MPSRIQPFSAPAVGGQGPRRGLDALTSFLNDPQALANLNPSGITGNIGGSSRVGPFRAGANAGTGGANVNVGGKFGPTGPLDARGGGGFGINNQGQISGGAGFSAGGFGGGIDTQGNLNANIDIAALFGEAGLIGGGVKAIGDSRAALEPGASNLFGPSTQAGPPANLAGSPGPVAPQPLPAPISAADTIAPPQFGGGLESAFDASAELAELEAAVSGGTEAAVGAEAGKDIGVAVGAEVAKDTALTAGAVEAGGVAATGVAAVGTTAAVAAPAVAAGAEVAAIAATAGLLF